MSVLLIAALLAGASGPLPLSPRTRDLAPTPCQFEIPAEVRSRVNCYWLTVPRRYDERRRGTYRLAVMIRQPAQPRAGAPTVLWLHGGPGSGISERALADRYPFVPGAPFVMLASRGAPPSEPQPCTDLNPTKLTGLAGTMPLEERARRIAAPFLACRARLDALGIRTDEFGTRLNTEDIERLRRALEVRQWTVWTGSYGTGSATDLLARYPGTVRAAILLSPIAPTDTADAVGPTRRPIDPLGIVARHCAADPGCRNRFPDLVGAVALASASLAERPITLGAMPTTVTAERFVLAPDTLDWVVSNWLGSSDSAASIPRLLGAVAARDVAALDAMIAPTLAGYARSSIFGRASFHCPDRPQFRRSPFPLRPSTIGGLVGVCANWSPLREPIRVPKNSPVPVLILPGEFDPTTPAYLGKDLHRILGARSQLVVVPGESHMPYLRNECALQIVHAFAEQPLRPVDRTCLAQSRLPPFVYYP